MGNLRLLAAKLAAAAVLAVSVMGSAPAPAACGTGAPPYGIKCPTVIDEAVVTKFVYWDWYTQTVVTYWTAPDHYHYVKTTTVEVWGKYRQYNFVCGFSGTCGWFYTSVYKNHLCGSKVISVVGGP
jgi:hypothetical protein